MKKSKATLIRSIVGWHGIYMYINYEKYHSNGFGYFNNPEFANIVIMIQYIIVLIIL